MSSSPLSSKSTYAQSQAQLFNQQNGSLTPTMSVGRNSPGPSTISTTRIVAPRPFCRSQVTPDPFDYSNNSRRQADNQQLLQNQLQRRYSANQINAIDNDNASIVSSNESLSLEFPPPPSAFSTSSVTDDNDQFIPIKKDLFVQTVNCRSDSGSSLSNSYLSEHEPSSPIISMHPHYHQQYRAVKTNNNRAIISVNSTQSPLITIASAGSPSRSEIRVLSSPNTSQSTLREIRISRPDSPSISINRSGINQPITITSNSNGGIITNGSGNAFHISLGAPTNPTRHGRTSPSFHQIEMHRDSVDNRYSSNVVANRFKPLIAYTNLNSNTFDRSSNIVNLPPAASSTSLTMRNGNNVIRKEQSDVDQLTKILMKSMNSSNNPNFIGMCARCNDDIVGEENGLVAMDRMHHVACFTCTMCGCRLRGMHFYSMENQPYCEPCYINSLEKCVVCARPITDRILRATGKPYHAQCFCCVTCEKSLDGIPFTIDASMQIHCIDCFHQKFAPRCYACHRPILPITGQDETVRIVALDRSYHIDCYRCENCKIQFTNEQGCYPIDDHVFCVQCNLIYSRTMLGHS